jgi:hypothetical protein
VSKKGHRYKITNVTGDAPKGVEVGAVLVERRHMGKEYTWALVDDSGQAQATWDGKHIGTCELPGIPVSEFS